MNDIKISYYNRIDVSEGIDINKASSSKECDICHYCYFVDKGFNFQPYICSGCHDVLVKSMNLSDIATLKINDIDYRCIIIRISKSEAINVTQYVDLSDKKQNITKYKNLFSYIKMGKKF